MNSLTQGAAAHVLERLHREADAADAAMMEDLMARMALPGVSLEQFAADQIARERADYRAVYHDYADNFLAVSPSYGRFLYMMARACKAQLIVEFGSSMGLSTIYLAAALRDNGGGRLIGTELEAGKAARARAHLGAAGLLDLVEIREGDAIKTLRAVEGEIDLLMLDGAFAQYLPVLRLLEPSLRPGAIVMGENALEPGYRAYVRDPANGYVSLPALEAERGNELSVRAA